MGNWFKKKIEEAKQEIEEKVSDKLMEEELNPTLRKHKGEPPTDPQKDKK
jgi:hypothetical protein